MYDIRSKNKNVTLVLENYQNLKALGTILRVIRITSNRIWIQDSHYWLIEK